MFTTLVDVCKHQFRVQDRGLREEWSDFVNSNWHAIHMGLSEDGFTVFTNRSSGPVPLTIELASEEPGIDERAWSHIVLGHFVSSGGAAVVLELFNARPSLPIFELSPGTYHVLVCFGDVDSTDYDGQVGADHYRIVMWRGDPVAPRALKSCGEIRLARRSPVVSVERCDELLASGDRHARWSAFSELARQATPEAVERLQTAARTGDAIDRVVAIGAFSTGLPIRIDQLERFAFDKDVRVRGEVLPVVLGAMLDFEFERCGVLDTDAAYRLLNHLSGDADRSIQREATSLMTKLDGLAELASRD